MKIHARMAMMRALGALCAAPLLTYCSGEPLGVPESDPSLDHEQVASREAADDAAAMRVADPVAAIAAWRTYDRPSEYGVASSRVSVPTRDGTSIDCTLSRPARDGMVVPGQHPGLVVEFTPYLLQADQYQKEASYFVARGYNTLVCLIRGIGGSGGKWQHPFSPQDGRDAHDLVEWLAVQPFSDGRIGMFGESYGGATTYGAAVEAPPHLRAIAPLQSPGALYDDVNYPGGIETAAWGPMNFWPPLAQLMSFGAISAFEEYALYHAHPTYDAFWQERTLRGRHDQIQVPVLALGGWTDNFFRSGMLTNVEARLDRTWVFYGQWVHTIPIDLGTCETQCAPDPLPGGVLLAWFDRWVMERSEVPVPDAPTFLSFEGPTGGGKGWRQLSQWLPQGSDFSSYELGSDGTLASKVSATKPLTFHEPGTVAQKGAALTFTTAPLEADRVLVGRATLDLRATLSASDANFYVQLLDVDDENAEVFVNDGFLKASHRTSHARPVTVPPGRALDYHIEIRPQHYRFRAGHRLRIRLWGGPPDTLVQPKPVAVKVETGARSRLRLSGFAAVD